MCRQLVDPEDELRDFQSDSVPSEVREWLASTFTRQRGRTVRCSEDKPRFRSIVHAVQAGIFVERFGLFVIFWCTFLGFVVCLILTTSFGKHCDNYMK